MDNQAKEAPVARPKIIRLGHFRKVPIGTPTDVLMDAQEILHQARGCISRGWCQLAAALDHANIVVSPLDRHANAWSIHGAMTKAVAGKTAGKISQANDASDMAWRALQSVIFETYQTTPEQFNERVATHASQVEAVFDEAIALFTERLGART